MNSILITGGAGFIGTNAALHFYKKNWEVSIIDNLSRKGAEINLKWLLEIGNNIKFYNCDIRDEALLRKIFNENNFDLVLHLAAQVAVTTSCLDPREDFNINALGTFNLLESIRLYSPTSFFINASTNKVYGSLKKIPIKLDKNGYKFENLEKGISESNNLDFHSPYGCSKGVADQYTIDYSKIYGLKTCTFRQSCIYGERQFGIEDQGWVAWFIIASMQRKTITIFGDGWQTRDILEVKDLCEAYEMAWLNKEIISGNALNIGGGYKNTLCLRNLINILEDELDINIDTLSESTRPGDQPVYISDISKANSLLKWSPKINTNDGIRNLINWVKTNPSLFQN
jgi:CDP-paratose 2-epimerase